jgi:hypothetical protein
MDYENELRDKIAIECMKAEVISWNSEMSKKQRIARLQDWIKRHGDLTINESIAIDCYQMADAMLKARG